MSYEEQLLRELSRARSAVRALVFLLWGDLLILIGVLIGHMITGAMLIPLIVMIVVSVLIAGVWLYFRWTINKLRNEVRKLIDGDRY
jgi:hypothetical protein